MIITAITTKVEKIPLRTPFVTALRRVEDVESVRVIIHTDSCHIGLGSAPATKAITGENLKSIVKSINKSYAPQLIGQTFELQTLLEILHNNAHNSSAKAAVDMALYDLASLQKSQNIVGYLNAKALPIESAITISLNEPQLMAQDSLEAYERGFKILKIKLGGGDGLDVERMIAIRESVPHAKLLVDANQAWRVEESLNIIKSLYPLQIELIEQPVIGSDLKGLQRITQESQIPILADEAVFNLEDAKKVIEMRAADLINIKLMKCGGISKAIEIIEYCDAHGVKCMMGSMIEGPISINLTAQLVMAYHESFAYVDLDSPLLYKKIPTGGGLSFFNNIISLEKEEAYYLYILECADHTFYTGIARDVTQRVEEHNSSPKAAKYTRVRRPVKMLYCEKYRSKSSALKREIEIKKMSRSQKERLISTRGDV